MTRTIATALAALALSAAAALAEMPEGPWTLEQLRAIYPELSDDDFVLIDTNRDGLVAADELDAAVAAGVVPAPEG